MNRQFIFFPNIPNQYSTKQLPKNVLAAQLKSIDDFKPRKKDFAKVLPVESLHELKTVSFDHVHATNVVHDVPKTVKDATVGEQKKEIINWEPTPLADPSKLTNQYLMLSKIRLTSMLFNSHGFDI